MNHTRTQLKLHPTWEKQYKETFWKKIKNIEKDSAHESTVWWKIENFKRLKYNSKALFQQKKKNVSGSLKNFLNLFEQFIHPNSLHTVSFLLPHLAEQIHFLFT